MELVEEPTGTWKDLPYTFLKKEHLYPDLPNKAMFLLGE